MSCQIRDLERNLALYRLRGAARRSTFPQAATTPSNTNKESKMDRRFGYFVFGGAAIGALLGMLFTAGRSNAVEGLGIGALVGVAIGWFAAAAWLEQQKEAARKNKQ
jgi:hypothetical protein